MGSKKFITLQEKKDLELFLKEGFSVSMISSDLGIHKATIYKEIRNGVDEFHYKNKQYIKYSAEKSMTNDENRRRGLPTKE